MGTLSIKRQSELIRGVLSEVQGHQFSRQEEVNKICLHFICQYEKHTFLLTSRKTEISENAVTS